MVPFVTDYWQAETERNQIPIRVIKIFYAELSVGGDASMLIRNNNRLVRPIRQEDFCQLRASRVISSLYVLIKVLLGWGISHAFVNTFTPVRCITIQNQARIVHLVHACILPWKKKIFNTGSFLVKWSLVKEQHRSLFCRGKPDFFWQRHYLRMFCIYSRRPREQLWLANMARPYCFKHGKWWVSETTIMGSL